MSELDGVYQREWEPEDLFVTEVPEDLYRSGAGRQGLESGETQPEVTASEEAITADSKTYSQLTNVRERDIKIEVRENGVRWVVPPGGISVWSRPVPDKKKNNWWRLKANTPIPNGLVITRDHEHPEHAGTYHHTIAPAWAMTLLKYQELLLELKLKVEWYGKY